MTRPRPQLEEHPPLRPMLGPRELTQRLPKKLGLSVRDIGELLDLSHQRVQQVKG